MGASGNVPTDPRQRSAWVIYQLKLRGLSLRGLALAAGLNPATLRGAIYQPSYPQERILAEAIGVTVAELFPERYDAEGTRLHKVYGEQASAPSLGRHGKKTRAA